MAQSSIDPKFDSPPRDLVKQPGSGTGSFGTPRWYSANTAELYYDSLQYEGLANWETETALKKRKPREIIPLFKTAIDTLHSFIWGGSRFPRVTVAATRTEDSVDDDEIGPRLWDDDASTLTTFVQEMMRAAKLDRAAGEYSRKALVSSSCAVLLCVKAGKLRFSVEPGKHCTPRWSADDPAKLESLEIVYQYEPQASGVMQPQQPKRYWFRRVIDDTFDTVFQPVEVTGATPQWTPDPTQTTKHDLGFCPAIWVRTLPMSSDAIDGCSVIDPALYKLLDRVNYIYSLRGRSAEYNLDPQWVRKNVSPMSRTQLQKAASKVWDLEDESAEKRASIELVEANGSGAETADKLVSDLRKRFTEAVRIVIADPDAAQGRNISGVVLEYLHAPMIALASDLRKDLGDDALGDLINLALRMICVVAGRGEDIYIQGVKKAVKIMMTAQLGGPWLEFPVRLQWGRFFSPAADESSVMVQAAVAAKTGGLVSSQKATQLVADLFGVVDVGAELDTVADEKAQAQQDAIKNAQAMAATQPPPSAAQNNQTAPPNQNQKKTKPKKSQRVGAPKP